MGEIPTAGHAMWRIARLAGGWAELERRDGTAGAVVPAPLAVPLVQSLNRRDPPAAPPDLPPGCHL